MKHHHCLSDISLPQQWRGRDSWVKGDMVITVRHDRLDRIKIKEANGKRRYITLRLGVDELRKVRVCVLEGLHLGYLTKHLK